MNYIANVIGATGLVGNKLTLLLLENPDFKLVRIFTRRKTGIIHQKLEEQIIDFRKPGKWEHLVEGDILFSALGTTLKQAGSKENEYEVDFTFNLNFAKAAHKNKVPRYILVSSVGANPKSRVFYSRMKGELEDEIARLSFENLVIFRPSVLAGQRTEKRPMEVLAVKIGRFLTKFIFRKYKPVNGETVAKAMISSVLNPDKKKVLIVELDEIFSLAGE